MTLLIYCLVWIVLAMANGILEDFRLKEDYCLMYDTCQVNDRFRMCSCDDSCFEFGTCCRNALGNRAMTEDKLEQWCNRESTQTPVFAKRTCARNFTEDERVVAGCRTGGDLIENVLVSSKTTRNTYWNWNCAICNHEDARNLAYWKVQVLCPARHRGRNITRDLVQENLVYRERDKRWGLNLGSEFFNCSLMFSQPPTLIWRLKYCAPNLVDSCPPDYHDENVTKECAAYYGERKDRDSPRYFKNVHCAICNGHRIEDLTCFAGSYPLPFHVDTSETITLSFESDDWKKIGMGILRCGNDMEYDPFQDQCRSPHISDRNDHNLASIDDLATLSIVLSLLLICVRNKLT